jgi:glucose/arabinose dehydrogenase
MTRGVCRLVAVAAIVALGAICAAGVSSGAASTRHAAAKPKPLRLVPVASRFASPTYVTAPRTERGRLYVVEQAGRIVVLEGGRRRVFLDIRRLVRSGGEQGLLSVAFHPSYATNRRLYVDYTDRNGDTRVVQYRSNGDRALPGSAQQLLFVNQPYPNHNGGQLAFGPDGKLYVGMGDGGSAGDPENRAQSLDSSLGKLLTLDTAVSAPRPEVAAYGLRNPWRFSFDRATGALYIGDVGQGAWEEVDITPRQSAGPENYGWNVYEGRARYTSKTPTPGGHLVFPVAVYSHSKGCSVTGGYVYRGRKLPRVRGRYFYGDYCSGRVWSLRWRNGRVTSRRREPFRVPQLSSFGEDARGEVYLVTLNGTIYRLGR